MRRTVFGISGSLLAAALAGSALAAGTPAFAQLPAAVGGQPLPSLAPMLAEVTTAVVNIPVVMRTPEENPLFADPFFRRFFDLPDRPPRGEQAAGSGVIVDAAKGLVITNYHVVKDAQEIAVGLIPVGEEVELGVLRAGDLVIGVNRARVRSVPELFKPMRGTERPVRLSLLRGEYRITLVVR